MASGSNHSADPLTPDERKRFEAIRAATSLSDLAALTGADSEHEAYFAAKREWYALQEKRLAAEPPADVADGIPGECVDIDGHTFCVHGVTHADTQAEGEFLREHVSRLVEAGETVYCEQGIRPMYFADFPDVCAMDDYRWALHRCRELDIDSHLDELSGPESGANADSESFEGILEDIDSMTSQFRDATFALIDSGSDVYGERFAAALGDVASDFFTSHEDVATGSDFEAFRKSKEAATNPGKLPELQDYYRKAFLPQPLEREWLRRHDRELELVTHARNERMADYARYHNEDAERVHLVVGAAHQPGVVYYLERHRDGERNLDGFEPVGDEAVGNSEE